MKNIAVFVSGGGSNLQSLINACKKGEIKGKICAVISSKESAYALKRAAKAGIPCYVFEKKNYENTEEMFFNITKLLNSKKIDYIVLAGYLTVIPQSFIKIYKNRIINIHPSLIPSFCGMGFYGLKVHQSAIDYGVKLSGCTVHFVDENADTGAIILQEAVEVKENDTAKTLQNRILEKEHILLPKAVQLLTMGKIQIDGRKVIIKE